MSDCHTCVAVVPALRRRSGQRARLTRPGGGPVAMVLVVPAVCALGRGLQRAQHHPRLHMRVRSAAIQRGAQAGAAGACVSAAPTGVPRGRRACKGAAKVDGKGTPLPGGALWAHFRKLGVNWSQLCNVHLMQHSSYEPQCTYKSSRPKAHWFKRFAKGTAKPFFQLKK